MKRFVLLLLMMWSAANALADDAENVKACVMKAKEFSGVSLRESDAVYEGNVFSYSTAKWNNVYCDVKFGIVYNLSVNNRKVIVEKFAGQSAYNLNQQLKSKTEEAVKRLQSRISLLEKRMDQASEQLQKYNPDQQKLSKFIDDGIEQSNSAHPQPTACLPESQSRARASSDNKQVNSNQNKSQNSAKGASSRASSINVFKESDFYWDENTLPHKRLIIAGVNKVHRENIRCKQLDPSSAYISAKKGTPSNPVFFVTCGSGAGTFNAFFSKSDVEKDNKLEAARHIDRNQAVDSCESYARVNATHPNSVKFSKVMNLSVHEFPNGRTSVTSTFTAKNSFNLEAEYAIQCLLDANGFFEAQISEKE